MSKRLLFVDDQESERVLFTRALERRGFEVTAIATVLDALEMIFTRTFDVVVADLKIEQQDDGYKVVRAMRERNPFCTNIILTAFPALQSAIEGMRYGVDDYLVKSDDIDDLVSRIEQNLQKRTPKAKILCVSYDELLLRTRRMLLEREGYEVVSSLGYTESLSHCENGGFDLFILGHSIPAPDKQALIKTFKATCKAPVVSLRRQMGEVIEGGADVIIDPEPALLLKTVSEILRKSS